MMFRLWRGELALGITFWLFGFGGGLFLGLPLFAAILALTDVPDETSALIFVAALGFFLVYLIWVSVGIWRSASRYQGDSIWIVCAKSTVCAEGLMIVLLVFGVLFPDFG
jgi:hypothetical protein